MWGKMSCPQGRGQRGGWSVLIDKLEAQELVQRCAGEDRRVKLIQLTEQGLAFAEETFAALQRVCAALMRPFSAAEQREFHRLLTRLLGNTR